MNHSDLSLCHCVTAIVSVCLCVVTVSCVVDMVHLGSDKRRPPTGTRFLNGRMGGLSHKAGSDPNLVGRLYLPYCLAHHSQTV